MEELNLDNDYFNYLLYCHQLSEDDGEEIISRLKNDYYEGKVNEFNMIQKLEDYCRRQIITNEKEEKISYLYTLIDSNDYYIQKVISQFSLNRSEIDEISSKIEDDITKDNIDRYIIKRNFRKYASENDFVKKNRKQLRQIENNIERVLFIRKKIDEHKNIDLEDVRSIIENLKRNIAEGIIYRSSMQNIIIAEIDILSSQKKLNAQKQLVNLIEKAPQNYKSLLRHYGLSESEGEMLIEKLNAMIDSGSVEMADIKIALLNTAEKIREARP